MSQRRKLKARSAISVAFLGLGVLLSATPALRSKDPVDQAPNGWRMTGQQRPPVDWVLLFDTSQTMLGKGLAKGNNIFADIKRLSYEFLEDQVGAGDSVQVISFDVEPTVRPPTFVGSEDDKAFLRQSIEGLRANGLYTYIALALRRAGEVVRKREATDAYSQRGRRSLVIIFTDGIDEPPPNARLHVDLRQALVDFPKKDTHFYFVNVGRVDDKNSLYQAMKATPDSGKILDHPEGERLPEVVPVVEAEVLGVVDFFLRLSEQPPTLPPEQDVEIRPVEIYATAPGQAELHVSKSTPGLLVEVAEPSPLKVEAQPWRPRLRVRGSQSLNDLYGDAELKLAPVGAVRSNREPPTVLLTIRFHALTSREFVIRLLRRSGLPLALIGVVIAAVVWSSRHRNAVELEGLLYVERVQGHTGSELVNLKSFRRREIVVGDNGEICRGEKNFRFRLHAEGTRGKLRGVRVSPEVGNVTVNELESVRRLFHDDEIAAGGYRFKYENFALQRPDET